jgi:hypothetical protein
MSGAPGVVVDVPCPVPPVVAEAVVVVAELELVVVEEPLAPVGVVDGDELHPAKVRAAVRATGAASHFIHRIDIRTSVSSLGQSCPPRGPSERERGVYQSDTPPYLLTVLTRS